MTLLTDAVRAAITAGRLAHLVTINPDGSPQVSLVLTGLEGDEVVIGHIGSGRKVANITRDPRVALSIEAEGQTAMGQDHYLVLHGTAHLTEGGAAELLQRLARTRAGSSAGPDAGSPPIENLPPGHVIHVTVTRVGGVGPWTV